MNPIKIIVIIFIAFTTGALLSYFIMQHSSTHSTSHSGELEPLYWVAPMDPNFRRDKPGKSPMGMDLIPVYAKDANQSEKGLVKISPVVENNLGVKTEKVRKENLELTIDTVGFVNFDADKVMHFHSRVDGWIETLSVSSIGDPVKKGQKLFDLYSPELVNVQEEYLTALKTGNRSLVKATQQKMHSLGISDSEIATLQQKNKVQQHLSFYAKKDGYVMHLNMNHGSFIKPADHLLSVGDLDTVWVIADILERQIGWVSTGQKVTMSTSSYPGETWQGHIDYVYPAMTEHNRTLPVRIVFSNKDHRLKPNMYTKLNISVDTLNNILTIPANAIINDGKMTRAVKSLGNGQYKSVQVITGTQSNHRIEIHQGLNEDDAVVTSAQFLIDSESSITADFDRMEIIVENTSDNEPPTRVWVTGTIQSIDLSNRKASITHEEIAEWSWPVMTMDFEFSEDINLDILQENQYVQFCLDRLPTNQYLITHIEVNNEKAINDNSTDQNLLDNMKHQEHMNHHEHMNHQEHMEHQ